MSLFIDGNSLTIEDVYQVSFNNQKVSLSSDAEFRKKIAESREFLEEYIKKGYPVYGVTTGFGDSCHNQINYKKSEKLQRSLVNFHGIGVGNYFSKEVGRAVLLVRLNSNIRGYSAIRPVLAEKMLEFLNKDIIPVIPEIGSVGASGDLTPLSYVAACLMGERKVYYNGKIAPTKDVLKEVGIEPIVLQAKEGLAIMNGTSVMTAVSALNWRKVKRLSNISDFLTGATIEVIGGNDVPYRRKVSEIKNHIGQIESSEKIYKVISDSKRVQKYEALLEKLGSINSDGYKKTDVKIQDRYSLRCSPQINGVVRDTLHFTKTWIENELNSSNDNPLIDNENRIIYNSGNFYGGHICAVNDYLRIAVANISDLCDKQVELLCDGKFNNLTENLTPYLSEVDENKGTLHGFKAAQITVSALCSEISYLSGAVSIHSRPTESLNQDKVSLGTISARKLSEAIELMYLQYSIHLLAVLQAVDLIGEEHFGSLTRKVFKDVREFTRFVHEDRPLDDEAKMVSKYLQSADLFNDLHKAEIESSILAQPDLQLV
ncbi:HAL/PAL/TAL family ammonia-lyase [Pseudobacteroides cellulosolvens]|uniref:Histidine ammonia-lyase n=1 Tax=Pseudobacteroides cellulosolvens ATCC 35603 = DSM 2933 TaxID=398512 RepID=A0A0L6JQS6_9FIRM|nr:aromatic amino acid ammonia-lyase [Pseudobacteroides cellulosolvens]KNY28149.1 Histidine ammonia-lyase [Pseudobacteroides cellulosolvens ATCC 35603 = DSM 2933]